MTGKIKENKTNVDRLLAGEQEYNEVHYLPTSKVGLAIVLICIISDYIFFEQIIDYHFTESIMMVRMVAFIMALAIDIIPTILVGCMVKQSKSKLEYVAMVILVLIEFSLFLLNALMRIYDADLIFSTDSTVLQSAMNTVVKVNKGGQKWLALILCIMPVATSVISFMIGVLDNNAFRKTHMEEKALLGILDEMAQVEAEMIEIEHVSKRNFEKYVDEHEKLVLADNQSNRILTYDTLRLTQALAAGHPQAASDIMAKRTTDKS